MRSSFATAFTVDWFGELAILIGVFLAFAATKTVAPRPDVTGPAVGTAEP